MVSGPTATLVRPEPPTDGHRRAFLVRPRDRAVVLASAQGDDVVDPEALSQAGWSLAQRRSGGGAVVVVPGAQVWLDVFVPAGDPLFVIDVARSADFLGELWLAALVRCGVKGPLALHRGGLVKTPFTRTACFASLGPGEVTLSGRKVVGCSQRRTRAGTFLHTMALLADHQRALAELLVLAPEMRVGLRAALEGSVGTLAVSVPALERALGELLATI